MGLEVGADGVEGEAPLLEGFDLEEAFEVALGVVTAPPSAEGGRNQALLDVVADGSASDAAELGQVAYGVLGVGHHAVTIWDTVVLATVTLTISFEGTRRGRPCRAKCLASHGFSWGWPGIGPVVKS